MNSLLYTGVRILSFVFVALILFFVYSIIRLITQDIMVMKEEKKTPEKRAYLKRLTAQNALPFAVRESYLLEAVNVISKDLEEGVNICFNDETMGSPQATVFKDDGVFYLRDESAAGTTLLNGEVQDPENETELKDGDKITVGRVTFLFVDVR